MSASLVGSEMCIRDRIRGPPMPSLRFAPLACWRSVPSRLAGSGPPRCWFCLLYTSDAADDM
eukprot:10102894-Alexandrium_andersonii.AAC.1